MLSFRTILPDTLELLRRLSTRPELQDMRLVGGTALALQYGHRQSIDLDFFGHLHVNQDELLAMARTFGAVVVLNRTSSILQLSINDIKVDFVNYSCYDWIDNAVEEEHLRLASPKDIAAMKINAIEGRGTKKDFTDLYVLLQHFSLAEILECYKSKYPEYSIYRALLSLVYFDDAELQDMPLMFIPDTWETMKETILRVVKDYQV